MSIRRFSAQMGATSRQATERVVRENASGDKGKLNPEIVLTVESAPLDHKVEAEIGLR